MVVLGIDAAWTVREPSGVALISKSGSRWRLLGAAPSYETFIALAGSANPSNDRPRGSEPDPSELLSAVARIADVEVDLIAVDMPLSRLPITGRREADNAVSRVYGARKCGTHTPSVVRPGPISDRLRKGFEGAGYLLSTQQVARRSLLEVYPHPALVELYSAPERLPYKLSKIRNYWPSLSPSDRRAKLLVVWGGIVNALEVEIEGVERMLPPLDISAPTWRLKAYEDMLDAVVCTWIGAAAIEGNCIAHGDEDAAIWIPTPFRR
ncbi:putative RNase H-like nuclease [Brevundimonas nasdae]|uniref:DUF429 domain-containing protein n=1 Tax=Brevundimonas nasdae TaxID=172043 RepID=UPI0019136358|nr:DUF429 domain-containing protein [Brevundimonas nasdae]MBK6023455.1 DUF429 domain-containing protein [Brevundimonas nasdae]MDQ0450102.1 putative RNase H-like nuclease [Brevundimonas nasdae]